MVTVTYGHGFLDDGQDTTGWTETNNGLTGQSISVDNGDYFKIAGTCDNVADEYVYYENDITDLSSDTYTKYLLRWKTSVSSSGLGAKVILDFTVGSQTILGSSTPEFSTLWNVSSGTITAAKTIDKIQLWADDYGDAVDSGTYYVYYDFILLHKDTFIFPHTGSEVTASFPPRTPILQIPGASGDVTQNLGSRLATVSLGGRDMELTSDWKRTGDVVEAELVVDLWHNTKTEPWQWLTSFLGNSKGGMKATLDGEPTLTYMDGSGFDIRFREKRTVSAADETYVERLGLNL